MDAIVDGGARAFAEGEEAGVELRDRGRVPEARGEAGAQLVEGDAAGAGGGGCVRVGGGTLRQRV